MSGGQAPTPLLTCFEPRSISPQTRGVHRVWDACEAPRGRSPSVRSCNNAFRVCSIPRGQASHLVGRPRVSVVTAAGSTRTSRGVLRDGLDRAPTHHGDPIGRSGRYSYDGCRIIEIGYTYRESHQPLYKPDMQERVYEHCSQDPHFRRSSPLDVARGYRDACELRVEVLRGPRS